MKEYSIVQCSVPDIQSPSSAPQGSVLLAIRAVLEEAGKDPCKVTTGKSDIREVIKAPGTDSCKATTGKVVRTETPLQWIGPIRVEL